MNTKGYEEAFEDVNRPNVESASEVVKNLQKKLEDVVKERDTLSNEVKVIKVPARAIKRTAGDAL